MATYRLKSKLFAFNETTWRNMLVNVNPDDPESVKRVILYKRKYEKEIAELGKKGSGGNTAKGKGSNILGRAKTFIKNNKVAAITTAGLGAAAGGYYLYNKGRNSQNKVY